jgi:acetyltransferase
MTPGNGGDLRYFFEPRSVAVIGSLSEPFGLGYVTISNLLHFGYSGAIHPVSPSYKEVHGIRAHADVDDLPDGIDLAMVITPAPTVPDIVDRCARRGIKAALVISENFAEVDEEGAGLQRRLVEIRRSSGIRIMGPNTVGLANTSNRFLCCPYIVTYDTLRKGGISYCSQTGFVGPAGQPLHDRSYPISKLCDVGNKCDVNEVDLLDYFAHDDETRVVAMHIEDVKDGHAFIDAARRLVAHKPLLVFKPGRSAEGAAACLSHTGSLAGDEQVYSSAFRQAGAIRVDTWQEFWEIPRVLASQPLPQGNRIAINTLTGGAGVVAVDAAVDAGLAMARLSPATISKLSGLSPKMRGNPVDMGPILSVSDDPYSAQVDIMATVINDPGVDCALIPAYAGFDDLVPAFMAMFDRLEPHITKPVVAWIYGMELPAMESLARMLGDRGVPSFLEIETAIKALGAAARYREIRSDVSRGNG